MAAMAWPRQPSAWRQKSIESVSGPHQLPWRAQSAKFCKEKMHCFNSCWIACMSPYETIWNHCLHPEFLFTATNWSWGFIANSTRSKKCCHPSAGICMAQARQLDMNPTSSKSAEQCWILSGWGVWQSWANCFAPTRSSQSWSIGSVPWAALAAPEAALAAALAAAPSATRLPSFGAGLGAALPELPPLGPFSCDFFTWPWLSYAELQIPRTTWQFNMSMRKLKNPGKSV